MKKILVISFFLSFIQLGCEGDACLKGSGDFITETRDLNNAYEISLHDNLNLDIYRSNGGTYAIVKGGENVVPFLKTEVSNGLITIKNENKCNFLRSFDKDIKIDLYVDSLTKIIYDGSGNIYMASEFTEEKFEFYSNQGSGTADLFVNCKDLIIENRAAISDIIYIGNASFAQIYNEGSGWINLCQGSSDYIRHAQVFSSSTGDVVADIGCRLDYTIAGIGNIQVRHEELGNDCDSLNINSNENTGKGRLIELK